MTMQEAKPDYEVGETIHDNQTGLDLGMVAHRFFNEVTGRWHYTIENNMSRHTGVFRLYVQPVR